MFLEIEYITNIQNWNFHLYNHCIKVPWEIFNAVFSFGVYFPNWRHWHRCLSVLLVWFHTWAAYSISSMQLFGIVTLLTGKRLFLRKSLYDSQRAVHVRTWELRPWRIRAHEPIKRLEFSSSSLLSFYCKIKKKRIKYKQKWTYWFVFDIGLVLYREYLDWHYDNSSEHLLPIFPSFPCPCSQ